VRKLAAMGKEKCELALGLQWLSIAIPADTQLTKLRFYKRTGCCQDKVAGAKVLIDDKECGTVPSGFTDDDTGKWADLDLAGTSCDKLAGTKLTITREGTTVTDEITLEEVEAWGASTDAEVEDGGVVGDQASEDKVEKSSSSVRSVTQRPQIVNWNFRMDKETLEEIHLCERGTKTEVTPKPEFSDCVFSRKVTVNALPNKSDGTTMMPIKKFF
jgi:hypothetical protein